MAFRATTQCLSGLVNKQRFRLTPNQKQRLRNRIRNADSVIDVLVASKVQLRELDEQRLLKREFEMTPKEKYWVESRKGRDGVKPIHWVPKWTKIPHPRKQRDDYQSQHETAGPIGKDAPWDPKA